MKRLLTRFAVAYVFAMIAVAVIGYGLEVYAGFDLPSGVSSVVPFVVAVQVAAQTYARDLGAPPDGSTSWRIAFAMTGTALAISLAAFVALALALGGDVFGVFLMVGPVLLLAVLLVVLAFYLLGARFMFPFMVRTELKAIARRG